MSKFAITTVGCRLNRYESEQLANELTQCGFERVMYDKKADLYIINTCTVTGRADSDCRNLIRRACRINSNAVMVVAGCYVDADKESISELEGVSLLVDNNGKRDMVITLREKYPALFSANLNEMKPCTNDGNDDSSGISILHRPLVKIGTGCNQNCSYCIVPRVRGSLKSLPAGEIIGEINKLVDEGYHEIVLTAVHIGKYSHSGVDLAGLIEKIIEQTHLTRLRLSSLEPNELNDSLIDFVANHPQVCRHLHLPLQSGSDRILKLMKRPYDRAGFFSIIEKIKRANEYITIGCDLIVGFPGETDKDFTNSIDILNSGFIDYGHIFSYSDRPGTAANEMPDKINPLIIKERSRIAREACTARKIKHSKNNIGQTLDVISAGKLGQSGFCYGISDNYLRVKLPNDMGNNKNVIQLTPHDCEDGILITN